MPTYPNVLAMIGNTPLMAVHRLDTGPCELFLKLENQNPGGSIKDRVGLYLIEAAERSGQLAPGATLIEATAGNTGLGLALVAAQKGYRLLLVIPDKMSQEKIFHLKAMGAEVQMTRSDVSKGHPEYYRDLAERLARETPGAYFVNQFGNPANARAHAETTAPEIWEQMGQRVDAIVCGAGTGGTIAGLSQYFARTAPQVELILADPVGSGLASFATSGRLPEAMTPWLVEGIGGDTVPPVADFSRVRQALSIPDAEAFRTCRELLAREGIIAGTSTGTLLAAALRYCRAQRTPRRVVTFVCDSGNKYLSKVYNDYWMLDQGFLEREQFGDLRDLIARRHTEHAAVTVNATETVMAAYRRMKLYDVSQVPVMQDGRIVGIVDEEDILLEVVGNPAHFAEPVTRAMSSNLVTVPVDAPITQLLEIFRRGMVAIVMHDAEFQGLITRIDLLNWLRRRQ
ncbi:MAG: pyridoxal-phosphate dependent enzyme [Gammaproteobacteria bacterium]|nr:pyridoxal-phosphate dependent enzyme [Gammaproteobacteria bacterium]MBV9621037.1 pyridoxal-phosphate dependent enzyme [Gammaproteobacteria bacterium]